MKGDYNFIIVPDTIRHRMAYYSGTQLRRETHGGATILVLDVYELRAHSAGLHA